MWGVILRLPLDLAHTRSIIAYGRLHDNQKKRKQTLKNRTVAVLLVNGRLPRFRTSVWAKIIHK
ncbi:MAG: hypothetical protein GY805_09890 [Chloroflexi bacterium]|nr:hypothetical protein [Chloroflexota bacterium]